jgi:GNAT superfamily N-acetyltransferase
MSDFEKMILRKLSSDDIPYAMEVSTEAGWNQTSEDWRTLIELSPEGCFGVEVEGVLASTATLLCYGRRLAWVGMVLTRVRFRGRGYARRLLTETLKLADQKGIETVKLDATDQGQPLYEKLGFRCEQPIERWMRSSSSHAPSSPVSELSAPRDWYQADQRAFGADRTQLLEKLALRTPPISAVQSSYLLTRPGRTIRYLGPCVAERAEDARLLVTHALQRSGPIEWFWDLFPRNKNAVAIARELSFAPKRHLMRMARGKDLPTREEKIYAISGFELG